MSATPDVIYYPLQRDTLFRKLFEDEWFGDGSGAIPVEFIPNGERSLSCCFIKKFGTQYVYQGEWGGSTLFLYSAEDFGDNPTFEVDSDYITCTRVQQDLIREVFGNREVNVIGIQAKQKERKQ